MVSVEEEGDFMKCFMIEYEIDNGARFYRDTAIVYAVDEPEAKIKLQYFVGYQDSETYCSEIFSVKEIRFDIFTGEFGYRGEEIV